jgi:hypothetical protein
MTNTIDSVSFEAYGGPSCNVGRGASLDVSGGTNPVA